jgi:hypothetical protein
LPDDLVSLSLRQETADKLHATLEELLASGHGDPVLEEVCRVLAWRILAAKAGTGSGLTASIAELARDAKTVEEYEAARDEILGPLLDGLESGENRDP